MNTSNRLGFESANSGEAKLKAVNPSTQKELPETFVAATEQEVNKAVQKAQEAWKVYRSTSGAQKAQFLRTIASEIEGLGEQLISRACKESGLPSGRITGERGRTCGQLRLFADLVEAGHWVDAVIDSALPDRKPNPRVDIRRMLQAMGPVVVFTASNFPLAFSTAGGDTASALAAGCPVIVKAHPSHLGTNALVSEAIIRAAQKCGMPDGVFSNVQDASYAVGTQLVQHPDVKAVAFTGSMRGGMALHKAAMERSEPIPVFAEMGSTNPVFIMPDLLKDDAPKVAQQVADSVNLGAGQFCTNPGMVLVLDDDYTSTFVKSLASTFAEKEASTMLNEGIFKSFEQQKNAFLQEDSVEVTYVSPVEKSAWKGFPAVATTTGRALLHNPKLHEEVFGPFTLVIKCKDLSEMKAVASELHGQLTATILGPEDKLIKWNDLANILQEKVGRLIFNGLPTGVEVGYAMQHGGPFPATTDSRFTSVGTDAIKRFARPIAFQNCPDGMLPAALKTSNPLNLVRTVNGEIAQH